VGEETRTSSFCAASSSFFAAASAFLKASSSGRSGLTTTCFLEGAAASVAGAEVAAAAIVSTWSLALVGLHCGLLPLLESQGQRRRMKNSPGGMDDEDKTGR
jgi:hypothetical protein